jgi:hypothetical protein
VIVEDDCDSEFWYAGRSLELLLTCSATVRTPPTATAV